MKRFFVGLVLGFVLFGAGSAFAGRIFVTGHDPIWHAQIGGNAIGARNLAQAGINFAVGSSTLPFLFVESITTAVPSGNFHTAPFLTSALGYAREISPASRPARRRSTPQMASSTPETLAAATSSAYSVSNWRTKRDRLAPTAIRIAISCSLVSARASSRLATVPKTISRTKLAAPSRTTRAGRIFPTTSPAKVFELLVQEERDSRSSRRWYPDTPAGADVQSCPAPPGPRPATYLILGVLPH